MHTRDSLYKVFYIELLLPKNPWALPLLCVFLPGAGEWRRQEYRLLLFVSVLGSCHNSLYSIGFCPLKMACIYHITPSSSIPYCH